METHYSKNECDFDTSAIIFFKENDEILYKIEYLYPNFFDNYIYEQTICFVVRTKFREDVVYFHPFGIVANRVNVDFYQRETFLNSYTLNHDLFMLISLLFKLKEGIELPFNKEEVRNIRSSGSLTSNIRKFIKSHPFDLVKFGDEINKFKHDPFIDVALLVKKIIFHMAEHRDEFYYTKDEDVYRFFNIRHEEIISLSRKDKFFTIEIKDIPSDIEMVYLKIRGDVIEFQYQKTNGGASSMTITSADSSEHLFDFVSTSLAKLAEGLYRNEI